MGKSPDTIVIGLGAMGSATVYQLAKQGQKVFGIDQFSPPHAKGSSHGDTRITRLAIGEGEHYSPFALRSHELWREIEAETRTNLLTVTGGLIIGSESAGASHGVQQFFEHTVDAARKHGITHRILTAGDIRKEFPPFAVQDEEVGYYEEQAGFLRPEACIRTQLTLAEKYQADIRRNERVLEVIPGSGNDSVTVRTDQSEYQAEQAVLTTGPWIRDFLPEHLAKHFMVYRQVLYWFGVQNGIAGFESGKFPVFIWSSDREMDSIYGFPAVDGPDGGVKVATEQFAASTTPESFQEEVTLEEREKMQRNTMQYLPQLSGPCMKAAACKYTCTKDFGFVIDRLPDHPQILVASPCSGHGFKHSAAVGEAIAQTVKNGKSELDLSKFTFNRFE